MVGFLQIIALMTLQYFVGIDIAKSTLDITVLKEGKAILRDAIKNTPDAIHQWLLKLKSNYRAGGKNTLFCLEHMGIYDEHLHKVLRKAKAQIWLQSPLHIKRSLGLQRGKTDKLDAYRIAQYAYTNRESFKLRKEPSDNIQQLKHLSSLRQRLLLSLKQLQHPLKESKPFFKHASYAVVEAHCKSSLSALAMDLQRTEATILEIVQSDPHLKRLYQIITSVVGIGPVVAVEIIIATNAFQNFETANQFACYCGIAPFEHSSGSSVHGKTKVSKLANRRIRPLLHMSAVASLRAKGDIKTFFDRKVGEGKHKLNVLNIIKNKIVHRIFACVKEDRLYQHIHTAER